MRGPGETEIETDRGAFGWDDESLPAIIFRVDERDITVRAVLTGEPEDDAVYSWSMTSRYVWGGVEEPGPALSALVNEMLTDSTDASLIARAVPDADVFYLFGESWYGLIK